MTPRKEIDGAEIFSNKELRNFEIVQKTPHHVCDYVNLLVHNYWETVGLQATQQACEAQKWISTPPRKKRRYQRSASAPPTTEGWGEPKLQILSGANLVVLCRAATINPRKGEGGWNTCRGPTPVGVGIEISSPAAYKNTFQIHQINNFSLTLCRFPNISTQQLHVFISYCNVMQIK